MDLSGEDKKKIEAKCDKIKNIPLCKELLEGVPKEAFEPDSIKPGETIYTTKFTKKEIQKKSKSIKEWYKNFMSPKKEEPKEDIFDICMHKPPCNLECLYGHKLEEEEEIPEPCEVKGLVYTKGGAVYETIAYRLPDEFAWEVTPEHPKSPEAPYFEEKKKKKAKKPEIMEFTGPVKIVVVHKDGFLTSYTSKRIHAGFIQVAYMLIGSTIMCIYFYTLKFLHHYSTNVHIISCTIAFHYCLPAALIIRNKCCIAGFVLSNSHQTRDALLLKTFAVINICVGVGIIYAWIDYLPLALTSKHSVAGFAACGFAVTEYVLHCMMAVLLGHDKGHIVDCYLNLLTVIAMVTSLKSLFHGLEDHRPLYVFFAYKHWYLWIYVSAVIFVLTALFRPCMDCLFHVWRYMCKVAKFLYKLYRPHDPCTPIRDMNDMNTTYNPYKRN